MLSKQLNIPEKCDGVVYWMSRDQRVQGDIFLKFFFENRINFTYSLVNCSSSFMIPVYFLFLL